MTWVKCPMCRDRENVGILPAISYEQDWIPEEKHDHFLEILNGKISPTPQDFEDLVQNTKKIWKAFCYYFDAYRNAKQ